jgi:phosphoglycolate phosphatase-like HAD superfamily hydrolase
VGLDSDGCVFDSMETKHKRCFIPNTIEHWRLQPIAPQARAAAEFVSLYSKWRGINRFPALLKTFELLRDWPEAVRTRTPLPDVTPLEAWVHSGTALANPALEAECARSGDPVLKQALEWSQAINRAVTGLLEELLPFPWVRECAEKLVRQADVICVSVAPTEELQREWQRHDIARYASLIAGQEMGGKKDHLKAVSAGKYAAHSVLMVGDTPGDLAAAQANGALFFPIDPGQEKQSWERFYHEGIGRFFDHTFAGDYQASLLEEFEKLLPETPPWKNRG